MDKELYELALKNLSEIDTRFIDDIKVGREVLEENSAIGHFEYRTTIEIVYHTFHKEW